MVLEVKVAPVVAEHLELLKAKAEKKPTSAEATMYRALARLLQDVFPAHGLDPRCRMKHSREGLYRYKHGRLRVFYAASKESGRLRVLFIGVRTEGDRKDAYEVFQKMLDRGDFDEQLAEVGL